MILPLENENWHAKLRQKYSKTGKMISLCLFFQVSPGFDSAECGKSKGCTMPAADSCYNVNGNIGASYRVVSPTEIEFEIFAPANTTLNENVYIALGFSQDEKMVREGNGYISIQKLFRMTSV